GRAAINRRVDETVEPTGLTAGVRKPRVLLLPWRPLAHGPSALEGAGICPLARLNGKTLVCSPFGPRPVVNCSPAMADLGQSQRKHARSDAGAAARDHRLGEIDAGFGEQRLELDRALERAVRLQHLPVRQIEGSRNVAGAQAGTWLCRTSGKALSAARIDDLGRTIPEQRLHVEHVGHEIGFAQRGEMTWARN